MASREPNVMEERLLGFDIRELWSQSDNLWDPARREFFLLRPNVLRPLAADTLVWPSLFDTGQGIGFPEPERQHLHLAGVLLPPYIGPNTGLWENARVMLRYLGEKWTGPRSYSLVAISWLSEDSFAEAGKYGPYLANTLPMTSEPWRRLGFDVADGSRLSGLSNCAYTPGEIHRLRSLWGPRLNQDHLFGDPVDALRFRDMTNARVPEHAPFFVYGLYLIGEVNLPAPERQHSRKVPEVDS
jgi:hypothetical protein